MKKMVRKNQGSTRSLDKKESDFTRVYAIMDMIIETAEDFFYPRGNDWEQLNHHAVDKLGKSIHANWIRVFQIGRSLTEDISIQTHWIWAEEGSSANQEVDEFDWQDTYLQCIEPLRRRETVYSLNWEENHPCRPFLEHYHIQSLLILPIFSMGKLWGGIGIESKIGNDLWAEEEIHALRTVGCFLGMGLSRQFNARIVRQSEEEYRSIVEYQTDIISRFDPDGTLIFVNDAGCKFFQKARADLLGQKVQTFILGEDVDSFNTNLQSLTPESPEGILEHRNEDGNGKVHWMQWLNKAFYDEHGELVEYRSVGRDITEKRALQDALGQSEARYRMVSQMVVDYAFSVALDGDGNSVYEWINRPPKIMMEYLDEHKNLQGGWQSFVFSEDFPIIKKHLKKAFSGEPDITEFRYLKGKGDIGWIRNHVWPEKQSAQGKVVRVYGAGSDITDQKLVEQRLRASEEEKALILDSLSELVNYQDRDFRLIWVNQKTADSLNLSKEDFIGKHCYELWHHRSSPCEGCPVARASQTKRNEVGNIESPDGKIWRVSGSPVLNSEGDVIGVVEATLDITKRTLAERRLLHRMEIEEMVASLSTRFINQSANEIEREIKKALQILGKYVKSSSCFISLLSTDGACVRKRYEWRDNFLLNSKNIFTGCSIEKFSWSMTTFRRNEMLRIPSVASLPEEARPEREYWLSQSIQSVLAMPLVISGMLLGYWGFVSVGRENDWQKDDLLLMKLMGDAFINVLVRKDSEEELRKERDFAEGLIETAQVIVLLLDDKGRITSFNPYFEELTGFNLKEVQGKLWFDHFVPVDDRNRIRAVFARALEKVGSQRYLNPILTHQGDQIDIEWNNKALKNSKGEIIGVLCTGQDVSAHLNREEELRNANEALNHSFVQLKKLHQESIFLNEMGELFQSCRDVEEIFAVISQYAVKLFPGQSGGLYILDQDDGIYKLTIAWGENFSGEASLSTGECWALRRGGAYRVDEKRVNLRCEHLGEHLGKHLKEDAVDLQPYICIPVVAQTEALGLLNLRGGKWGSYERIEQLGLTVSEQVGMAIANLRLREKLEKQSIRDPLTGLYNRRYMDETLERELQRAARQNASVSLLMMDIDRFKHYNDTHGHDAGDVLLQALGEFLQLHIRGSDVACRYGGEEFVLILPNTMLREAAQRAEELRSNIKTLKVRHRGRMLGMATISIGVAAFPQQGRVTEELLRAADIALYRAKAEGRDRVVVAGE